LRKAFRLSREVLLALRAHRFLPTIATHPQSATQHGGDLSRRPCHGCASCPQAAVRPLAMIPAPAAPSMCNVAIIDLTWWLSYDVAIRDPESVSVRPHPSRDSGRRSKRQPPSRRRLPEVSSSGPLLQTRLARQTIPHEPGHPPPDGRRSDAQLLRNGAHTPGCELSRLPAARRARPSQPPSP
jgi:hypothetical protein